MEPTNSTILHNITEHEGEYTTDSCALLKFIWEFGITGAICVLGMIGNSLSLVMFHRLASLSGVMMTLLKVLAWADLSYVTLYSLIQVWPQLVIYIGKGDVIQASLMYGYAYVWPFVSIMMSLSTWYTVLISVHRYIAVSNPLKVSLYSSPAKVKKHIIIVSVIAVVFDIPRFFEINVINIPVPAKNATTKSYVYSDVYKHYIYQLVYKNIIMTVYRKIIPLVIIIACSVRLIIAVHRARKTRERMVNKTNNQVGKEPGPASSSSAGVSMNTEMKVTITMLAIMVTFVVCQLPNAIYPIIRMLMDIDFYNLCDPIWIIIRVGLFHESKGQMSKGHEQS